MGQGQLLRLMVLVTIIFDNFSTNFITVKRYQPPAIKIPDYCEIELPINITYQDFKDLLLRSFDLSPDRGSVVRGIFLKQYGRIMSAHELESSAKISLQDRKNLLASGVIVVYFNDYSEKDVTGF